jgi:hypothetical protein
MGPAHLGIGFAVKPAAPDVPLWTLLVASESLDFLSFGFILIGEEKMAVTRMSLEKGLEIITPGSVPWSHGLFMSLVWSAAAALLGYLVFKDRRAGGIIGLVVFSHWILDFIVHPPDLPIFLEGSPMFGLGLWTSGPGFIASMILELALTVGGIAIYTLHRKRRAVKASTG